MMLKLDEERNWKHSEHAIAFLFERQGGIDALEEVQKHADYKVYQLGHGVLAKFFDQDLVMDQTTSAISQPTH